MAPLIKSGGKGGRALAARTVGHAHRVLHRALQRAVESETLTRNVASVIPPPKVEAQEIEILDAHQIVMVLRKLEGHTLYAIGALALATGHAPRRVVGSPAWRPRSRWRVAPRRALP